MTSPDRRRIWPVVRRIWITAGIGVTVVFIAWSLIAYRASSEAREATATGDSVRVEHADGVWTFARRDDAGVSARLVFFPGALVDPRAYAPLARAVARAGHPVTLVGVPRRAAFGRAESMELAERVQAALAAEAGRAIVVGGHSKGGVIASQVVADYGSAIDGLVLIGTSHPRDVDLSGVALPVTKIVGDRDGLASPEEVRGNARLLPEHTRWVWIEGGNHSQFGWYGFQPMDRRPRVSASEQRQTMIDAVLDLMRAVSEHDGARS